MATKHVLVIGGGPAGLFASRLIALRRPSWKVVLYERLPPLETFGFGVGLSGGTLRSIEAADRDVHADIRRAGFRYSTARFKLPAGDVEIPGFHSGIAIGRARLLQLLHRRAVDAGVDVRVGGTASVTGLGQEADLVIAADGVSSATREQFGPQFGSRVSRSRGLFIWCGSEAPLPGMVFAPVTTGEGLFVAHAYPYAEGRSTWVVETDAECWRRAGFDSAQTTRHGTDERAIDYLSQVFAGLLQGHRLIGNKSQWAPFCTVTCQRWSHGNVVLLGDAAANAHPSIGSGTKMALESAIALDAALAAEPDTASAAAAYEAARRPAIEQFQDRARRSQLWWESLGTRLHLSPERLAVAFLTRAGVVSVDALASSAHTLVRAAAAQFAGVRAEELPTSGLSRWVAERGRATTPADSQLPVDCADPWGSDAAEILGKARSLEAAGASAVELVGGASRAELLDRLAVAERIRAEVGLQVHVAAPDGHLGDIADALVAGRLDATPPLVS